MDETTTLHYASDGSLARVQVADDVAVLADRRLSTTSWYYHGRALLNFSTLVLICVESPIVAGETKLLPLTLTPPPGTEILPDYLWEGYADEKCPDCGDGCFFIFLSVEERDIPVHCEECGCQIKPNIKHPLMG
jgi:hypothetical protein